VESIYQINPALDVPIYQQLVDAIRVAMKKGQLPAGEQLPTVQLLSQNLGVAKGTVKRAYDALEQLGLVEKVQGRGTFVRYRPEDSGSSKERAMAAIDAMFRSLEQMGFSSGEINIFLNLKLREREEQDVKVKIAILECNPETLSHMAEQMHTLPNVDLYTYLIESVEKYPYTIEEDMDLVVTTATHAPFLESVLPEKRRIARVALRLMPHSLARIVKLRQGTVVGVLGYSLRFGQLLYNTCQQYTDGVTLTAPEVFTPDMDLSAFLQGKDVVLVPQSYEKYCSQEAAKQLHRFAGKVITCGYEMDEGSFLYLQEKTKRLLAAK